MKNLLPVFLILAFSSSWSQKTVVSRGIIVTNQYDEYLEEHYLSPEFTLRYVAELETKLKARLGDITLEFPSEAKIHVMDSRMAANFIDAIGPYQEYYRQRADAKKIPYDYIVEVRTDISDVFKGKVDNIKIVTRVVLKDASGKNVVHKAGKVKAIIPPPNFDPNKLLIDRVDIKQNFPLSTESLQDAMIKSLGLAFEEENELTITADERPTVHNYDAFIDKAIAYRLLAPVNYAKSRFKMKILGFYTLTRNRPIDITRLADNKKGVFSFEESEITDLNLNIGVPGVYNGYRMQRTFRLGLETANIPVSHYKVRGVMFAQDGVLGTGSTGPVRMTIINKDEHTKDVLEFTNNSPSESSLSQYNQSLGRMFSPFGKIEGSVAGRDVVVQSSPASMNTIEVLLNGELAGVISHPVTTRKYIRKNKKLIPFMVYISPDLSLEDESLVLQAFQFNRLAYLLKDHQDNVVRQLANKTPQQ